LADDEEEGEAAGDGMDPELAALWNDDADDSDDTAGSASDASIDDETDRDATDEDAAPPPRTTHDPDSSAAAQRSSGDRAASTPPTGNKGTTMDPHVQHLLDEMAQQRNKYHVDFSALLAPISEDEPAGGSVPYELREKLTEARKEIKPDQFADDDPMRPEEEKKADWSGIVQMCDEALTETSKDLLLAARMTEALVGLYGYEGLRDGLRLLRLMVAGCWDRLQPEIEDDDDLEVRAGPFNWLDDPYRGALFPTSVRNIPLVTADDEGFGHAHWRKLQEGSAEVTPEQFERAIMQTPRNVCQTAVECLEQSLADLDALSTDLDSKIGHTAAPTFHALRPAIEESLTLARQVLLRKGPAEDVTDDGESAGSDSSGASSGGAGGSRGSGAGGEVRSRDEAYRRLREAADVLQRLEPHSPIPYLVKRAVSLGALPFPDLMKAFIREQNVLDELNRELGIQPPQEAED
jgi:type VI secretion system protein ImpA